MLRFGTCPVYDRRDILVTMVNKSDMRTPYNFTDLAHFKITPQTGVLEPHQNISIIVSFTPSQLGVFKNRFLVTYCNGLTSDEIKLVAEADKPGSRKLAGGTEALPQDFERIRKFVDPEDVRAAKERGARGVGVEYDAGLVERAHAHVEAEGMAGKVEIRHADVCTVDFQAASMIFIYLVPEGIGKIYESLDAVRRRPGTRIVSYIFSVKAWEPIEVRVCKGVKLYLYTSDSKLRACTDARC